MFYKENHPVNNLRNFVLKYGLLLRVEMMQYILHIYCVECDVATDDVLYMICIMILIMSYLMEYYTP